jgi:hypothetical protein
MAEAEAEAETRGLGVRGNSFSLFLIFFIVIAFKSNDALTMPQFWAEDGTDFFVKQYGHGLPQIFVPYAGYLHAIPRLVAWLATIASPGRAPLIYNLAAIAMGAASLAFITGRLRSALPIAVLLATFLILPTSGEIFGNLTNVQWFLQLALPVACFSAAPRLRGWRSPARDLTLLLVALTGPFSLITALLVAGLWVSSWLDRRFNIGAFDGHLANWRFRRSRRTIAIVTAGGLAQLVTLLTHPMPLPGDTPPFALLKIGMFDLIPLHLFGFDFLTNGLYTALYLAIVGALIFGRGMSGEHRLMILGLLMFALVGALSGMAKTAHLENYYNFSIADRYFHALRIVFWWAVFAAIASTTTYRRRDISTVVMLCIVIITLSNLSYMRRGPMQDFQWKAHARELKQPGSHSIPINPPGWSVDVTTP